MYGLKLNTPEWVGDPTRSQRLTFRARDKKLAEGLAQGTRVFIYCVAPIKKIVGAVEITGTVEAGEGLELPLDPHCPVTLPCRLLEPGDFGEAGGLSLQEAGVGFIRPMPGKNYYPMSQEEFEAAYQRLAARVKVARG